MTITKQQIASGIQTVNALIQSIDATRPEQQALKDSALGLVDLLKAGLPQKADGTAYTDAELDELKQAGDDTIDAILKRHQTAG